jgi:hypothetical protein
MSADEELQAERTARLKAETELRQCRRMLRRIKENRDTYWTLMGELDFYISVLEQEKK